MGGQSEEGSYSSGLSVHRALHMPHHLYAPVPHPPRTYQEEVPLVATNMATNRAIICPIYWAAHYLQMKRMTGENRMASKSRKIIWIVIGSAAFGVVTAVSRDMPTMWSSAGVAALAGAILGMILIVALSDRR